MNDKELNGLRKRKKNKDNQPILGEKEGSRPPSNYGKYLPK